MELMAMKLVREGITLGIQRIVLILQSTNQCVRTSDLLSIPC